MRLGFLTNFNDTALALAREAGCTSLEIGVGPGSPLDAAAGDRAQIGRAQQALADAGIKISAFGRYCNMLHPDPGKRQDNVAYLLKLIDQAAAMSVPVVSTFAGALPGKSIPDTMPEFKQVWTPIIKHAEERGVKVAIENCPMFCGYPFYGMNIAYKPQAWDLMFEAVPSPNLGLEFDPSHLGWLHVDYVRAVRTYGARIYHVHAKDVEILRDRLATESIYGQRWWRFRIPGWGEVDWQRFIAALLDVGYQGDLNIEHEDPVFSGERFAEGIKLGIAHLRRYIIT